MDNQAGINAGLTHFSCGMLMLSDLYGLARGDG